MEVDCALNLPLLTSEQVPIVVLVEHLHCSVSQKCTTQIRSLVSALTSSILAFLCSRVTIFPTSGASIIADLRANSTRYNEFQYIQPIDQSRPANPHASASISSTRPGRSLQRVVPPPGAFSGDRPVNTSTPFPHLVC